MPIRLPPYRFGPIVPLNDGQDLDVHIIRFGHPATDRPIVWPGHASGCTAAWHRSTSCHPAAKVRCRRGNDCSRDFPRRSFATRCEISDPMDVQPEQSKASRLDSPNEIVGLLSGNCVPPATAHDRQRPCRGTSSLTSRHIDRGKSLP